VALNVATSATQVSFSLPNTGFTGTATPYLTDGTHSTARQSAVPVSGGALNATVPPRSPVTCTTRAGQAEGAGGHRRCGSVEDALGAASGHVRLRGKVSGFNNPWQ
jgi:hypothetical protein